MTGGYVLLSLYLFLLYSSLSASVFHLSVLADMDAADTAYFRFGSSGGAKTDDVVDGYLSGCLVV